MARSISLSIRIETVTPSADFGTWITRTTRSKPVAAGISLRRGDLLLARNKASNSGRHLL